MKSRKISSGSHPSSQWFKHHLEERMQTPDADFVVSRAEDVKARMRKQLEKRV